MLWPKERLEPNLRATAAGIIFENSPDAYCVIDGNKIVECNRAMEEIMACSRADLLGVTPEQLSPEFQPNGLSSDEMGAQMDGEVEASGFARFEWTHHRLDGAPCRFW